MRATPEKINSIELTALVHYLTGKGWTEAHKFNEVSSIWKHSRNLRPFSVLVPSEDVPDLYPRMCELLRTLSIFEDRPVDEILSDLLGETN
jgi:hypothetical protein